MEDFLDYKWEDAVKTQMINVRTAPQSYVLMYIVLTVLRFLRLSELS